MFHQNKNCLSGFASLKTALAEISEVTSIKVKLHKCIHQCSSDLYKSRNLNLIHQNNAITTRHLDRSKSSFNINGTLFEMLKCFEIMINLLNSPPSKVL